MRRTLAIVSRGYAYNVAQKTFPFLFPSSHRGLPFRERSNRPTESLNRDFSACVCGCFPYKLLSVEWLLFTFYNLYNMYIYKQQHRSIASSVYSLAYLYICARRQSLISRKSWINLLTRFLASDVCQSLTPLHNCPRSRFASHDVFLSYRVNRSQFGTTLLHRICTALEAKATLACFRGYLQGTLYRSGVKIDSNRLKRDERRRTTKFLTLERIDKLTGASANFIPTDETGAREFILSAGDVSTTIYRRSQVQRIGETSLAFSRLCTQLGILSFYYNEFSDLGTRNISSLQISS